jgi:hypothetical protein
MPTTPSELPHSYCSFDLREEEPQVVSSPIVKRFDELASAPSSAQERKRRREKLIDPDVVKSAAKNQAVANVQPAPSLPSHHEFSVVSPQGALTSPVWDAVTQRAPNAGGTPLPRSALSSPQVALLFASPERVRKLSDEERRYQGRTLACVGKLGEYSRCRRCSLAAFCHLPLAADVRLQDEVQALDRSRGSFTSRGYDEAVHAYQVGAGALEAAQGDRSGASSTRSVSIGFTLLQANIKRVSKLECACRMIRSFAIFIFAQDRARISRAKKIVDGKVRCLVRHLEVPANIRARPDAGVFARRLHGAVFVRRRQP